MAIDFKKRLNKASDDIKENPIEIYDSLDRKSVTGPLRPTQNVILEKWFIKHKNDKDLIIKLHTGAGKTLIGLLILQAKINANEGPCMYICPNIYLMNQVCEEAEKFGVTYCKIDNLNLMPDKFLEGKSILITYVQKVFHGFSIFGIDAKYTKVGCIVLDDSHACIDVINGAFTINITKKKSLKIYNAILNLFEEDLKSQKEGTYYDIVYDDNDSYLPISYWAWESKKSEVLSLLAENKSNDEIKYVWNLIKDSIGNCKVYISGKKIEISPYYVPIQKFGTFNNAKNRILMSATTQNDSFFINGLGLSVESIKNPLVDTSKKWSGEKMILIPSLIDDQCERDKVIKKFCKPVRENKGIVALVGGTWKKGLYEKFGAIISDSNSIFNDIALLKSGKTDKTLVLLNRYDGIDLPDDSCRIIIIDSLPYFDMLSDKYIEDCRPNSEIINRKIAQKIEQGLGRSVRGEKDYSVVLLIGVDLVRFVKSVSTKRYFSMQTQKQIEIGLELSEMSKQDNKESEDPLDNIVDIAMQSIDRDPSWKEYYIEEMRKMRTDENNISMYDIMELETQAEKFFYNGDDSNAITTVQKIIDMIDDENEKAWYIQQMARYTSKESIIESNRLQKIAYEKNNYLLKPKDGITYKRINYISGGRIGKIKKWLSQYSDSTELIIQLDNIMENLSFGMQTQKFEEAMNELGQILGFVCHRPDNMISKGPDNLWCVQQNDYIMFECKSGVKDDRTEISKKEAGQMAEHVIWFEDEYKDANVTKILVISTKNLSYEADLASDIKIMRKSRLNTLKKNVKGFIKEIQKYKLNDINDEKLQELIDLYKLDINNLKDCYVEDFYRKSK